MIHAGTGKVKWPRTVQMGAALSVFEDENKSAKTRFCR